MPQPALQHGPVQPSSMLSFRRALKSSHLPISQSSGPGAWYLQPWKNMVGFFLNIGCGLGNIMSIRIYIYIHIIYIHILYIYTYYIYIYTYYIYIYTYYIYIYILYIYICQSNLAYRNIYRMQTTGHIYVLNRFDSYHAHILCMFFCHVHIFDSYG